MIFDLAADGVAQVAGVARRVPGQVERAVLARLGRLDQPAVRLAQAVVVLGEGTELRLAAELAGLDIDTAAGAADALVTADLFVEGRVFAHPLVRSAIYEQILSGARARAHTRVARLLIREGVADEQIAAQLLKCEPAGDPDAVQALGPSAITYPARSANSTSLPATNSPRP